MISDSFILPASDYQTMPWKNGKGATDEVWLWPQGASRDDFQIRISRAPIVAEGAFSSFAGIERVITLIEGQGLALDFGASTQELAPFQPLRFDSGLAPEGRPINGPVRVLNVMARRSDWTIAQARILPETASIRAPLIIIFALEAQKITTGQHHYQLAPQDSLVSGIGEVTTTARALVVELQPVTGQP